MNKVSYFASEQADFYCEVYMPYKDVDITQQTNNFIEANRFDIKDIQFFINLTNSNAGTPLQQLKPEILTVLKALQAFRYDTDAADFFESLVAYKYDEKMADKVMQNITKALAAFSEHYEANTNQDTVKAITRYCLENILERLRFYKILNPDDVLLKNLDGLLAQIKKINTDLKLEIPINDRLDPEKEENINFKNLFETCIGRMGLKTANINHILDRTQDNPLKEKKEAFKSRLSTPQVTLLQALKKFRWLTDPGIFASLMNRSSSEKIGATFQDIATALEAVFKDSSSNSKNPDDFNNLILAYSIASILERLEDLQNHNANDKILQKFRSSDNPLKIFFSTLLAEEKFSALKSLNHQFQKITGTVPLDSSKKKVPLNEEEFIIINKDAKEEAKKIDLSHFKVIKVLGAGNSGEASLYQYNDYNKANSDPDIQSLCDSQGRVVLKTLRSGSGEISKTKSPEFLQEGEHLKDFSRQDKGNNCLKGFSATDEKSGQPIIITNFISFFGESLSLGKFFLLPPEERAKYGKPIDIVNAFVTLLETVYRFNENYVHRDLAARNIFLETDEKGKLRFVMGDFGRVKKLNGNGLSSETAVETNGPLDITSISDVRHKLGVLTEEGTNKYSARSDWYAIRITFLNMIDNLVSGNAKVEFLEGMTNAELIVKHNKIGSDKKVLQGYFNKIAIKEITKEKKDPELIEILRQAEQWISNVPWEGGNDIYKTDELNQEKENFESFSNGIKSIKTVESPPKTLADLLNLNLEKRNAYADPMDIINAFLALLEQLYEYNKIHVHRDFTPSNILLSRDEHGKLKFVLTEFNRQKTLNATTGLSEEPANDQTGPLLFMPLCDLAHGGGSLSTSQTNHYSARSDWYAARIIFLNIIDNLARGAPENTFITDISNTQKQDIVIKNMQAMNTDKTVLEKYFTKVQDGIPNTIDPKIKDTLEQSKEWLVGVSWENPNAIYNKEELTKETGKFGTFSTKFKTSTSNSIPITDISISSPITKTEQNESIPPINILEIKLHGSNQKNNLVQLKQLNQLFKGYYIPLKELKIFVNGITSLVKYKTILEANALNPPFPADLKKQKEFIKFKVNYVKYLNHLTTKLREFERLFEKLSKNSNQDSTAHKREELASKLQEFIKILPDNQTIQILHIALELEVSANYLSQDEAEKLLKRINDIQQYQTISGQQKEATTYQAIPIKNDSSVDTNAIVLEALTISTDININNNTNKADQLQTRPRSTVQPPAVNQEVLKTLIKMAKEQDWILEKNKKADNPIQIIKVKNLSNNQPNTFNVDTEKKSVSIPSANLKSSSESNKLLLIKNAIEAFLALNNDKKEIHLSGSLEITEQAAQLIYEKKNKEGKEVKIFIGSNKEVYVPKTQETNFQALRKSGSVN